MEPLAFKMRPKTLDDMYGNKKVIKTIKQMITNDSLRSLIIYGNPGVGKTTIANIIASKYSCNDYVFNAGVDNKARLKELIDQNNLFSNHVIIIDEIHRMKKDVQDYLLPYMESGEVIIIGLTTENPYHAINMALRSRAMIFKLEKLDYEDIKSIILRAIGDKKIDDEALELIFKASNGEARMALNILEQAMILTDSIKKEDILDINPQLSLGSQEDYYELLSALQKSIRGSDVNASLHYTARLLKLGDYESLFRRLSVIAYEDIGLGNPQIGCRLEAAISAFMRVGMPEGRIPIGFIIVDMALSPKSNSAYLAMDKAMAHFENNDCGNIPDVLNNNINKKTYKYPHDFKGHIVKQQYLPDLIKDVSYFEPCTTSNYETAIKERYEIIKTILK